MPSKFLTSAAAVAVLAAFAVPALAQEATLDPAAEAGKLIFEKTAGGVGCAMCHGPTAEGDIGPAIQGADPAMIRGQLDTNDQMAFISLSDEEIEQVSTYLRYLHDQAAH
ncbi:MAG: cytochrome c [Rhodobacteraceae bacterium]|nr:cytochrome c [Paracoccaceae bacterium]